MLGAAGIQISGNSDDEQKPTPTVDAETTAPSARGKSAGNGEVKTVEAADVSALLDDLQKVAGSTRH